MTWQKFTQRIERLQKTRRTRWVMQMNPRTARLPHAIQRYDDPFLPFGKAIVQATQDQVCAYWFDLASYLSVGAAGIVALERTIAYLGGETPSILHGPFVGRGYSAMADTTGFGVSAITVADEDDLRFYLEQPPFASFIVGESRAIPEVGGLYQPSSHTLSFYSAAGQITDLKVTDDDVLYKDGTDQFAETLRATLEQLREND